MRRPAALALGLAALACAAAPALAAAPTLGGVAVTIETAEGGGGTPTVSYEDVRGSADTTFDLLAATRASTFVERLARVPLDSVEWLRVDRVGTTGYLQLSEDDLRSGDGAFDAAHGNEVQFHWTAPDGVPRAITPASRDDLRVTIRTRGGLLVVEAGADRSEADAGAPVVLTASAPDAPAGTTYSWSFGDGSGDAPGASATHAYAADGVYLASATAIAPDGASGLSAPVRIQVGAPAPGPAADAPDPGDDATAALTPQAPGPGGAASPAGTIGGGDGGPQAPAGGPARGGAAGPADGDGRPPKPTVPAHPSRSRTAHPHGSRAASSARAAAPAATGPSPAPIAAGTPTPAAPAPPAASRPSAAGRHGRTTVTPPPPAGDTVRGLVLTGFHATGRPASAGSGTSATPAAAARAASGGAPGTATWLVLVPTLLLLLAAGAARELRHRTRPPQQLPRTSVRRAR